MASQPGASPFHPGFRMCLWNRNPSVKRDSCGKVGRPGLVPGPLGLPGPFHSSKGWTCIHISWTGPPSTQRPAPWGPSGATAHRGTCPFPPLGRGAEIQQPGFRKEMGGHEPSCRERKLPELKFPEGLNQASSVAGIMSWPPGLGRCQDRLQERQAGGRWGHCSELTHHHVPQAPSQLWLQPQTRLGVGRRLAPSLSQPVFTLPGP